MRLVIFSSRAYKVAVSWVKYAVKRTYVDGIVEHGDLKQPIQVRSLVLDETLKTTDQLANQSIFWFESYFSA